MSIKGYKNHPYIPNSVPEVQAQMLKEIGLTNLEQLHEEVPEEIKLKENMNLPPAIKSEHALKKHVAKILKKNDTCENNINFLGTGCWQHTIPAICDEINSRGEFLTAYGGEPYNDHGRFQALFEYQSMVAELVGMEVVNVPTMDWAQAAATAIRMASRVANRNIFLVSSVIDCEKLAIIKNYCEAAIEIEMIAYDNETGKIDIEDLKSKMSNDIAGVYIENPSYFGIVEDRGQEIADIVHGFGAQFVVGVDPSSLGVLSPPGDYCADIVAGELQPLGIHMNYGGGQAGFMATRDEEKYVMEFPSRLFGVAPTSVEGEYGFGDVAYDRTSFGEHREHGKEYVGTQAALWGITAGVYLATMGPSGMQELGQTCIQNSHYLKNELNKIEGVTTEKFSGFTFKEFVVDFTDTGKTVEEINSALLSKNIFGGKDISKEFDGIGECAVYCVTEVHTKEMLDEFLSSLEDILRRV